MPLSARLRPHPAAGIVTFRLRRAARSAGLVTVGVLSTLGTLSLSHVGPASAQSPGVNLAQLVATVNALKSQQATDEQTIKNDEQTVKSQGADITSVSSFSKQVADQQSIDEGQQSIDEGTISG